jgi:hypothetical protein
VFGIVISIILSCTTTWAASAHLSSFIADADASLSNSDAMHAYRSYSYLETSKPEIFKRFGLVGYLESVFILGPTTLAKSECDRLVATSDKQVIFKAAYVCSLEYTQLKQPELAAAFLAKITRSSSFYWPAQIILVANDFSKNDSASALKRILLQDISHFKKFDLEDEFHLSRARAFAGLSKVGEALSEYQAISSKSIFYINALHEMAIVFFKTKKFETAQMLIDVIRTNYEGSFRGAQKINVPANIYYDARYLEAYIDLTQVNSENATSQFDLLQKENEKYHERHQYSLEVASTIKVINEQGVRWADSRNFTDALQGQLQLISNWMSPDVRLKLEREITLQLTYAHEWARLNTYNSILKDPELQTYKKAIEKLKQSSLAAIQTDMTEDLKMVMQNIKAFTMKARLAKLEAVSMSKAQGTRSLDEVIDDYLAKVRQIDEFAPQ